MADFHRNIYAYYRGASQKEQDRERQIEDNTTKALINTLEHCDCQVVAEFLHWLEISEPGHVSFQMQRPTIGDERIKRRKKRLILAIVGISNSKNESVFDQLPMEPIGASRPDAWLYGEDFAVLLESKVGDATLELNQMACHWDTLHPTVWKILTWAKVHRFFASLAPKLDDMRSKWIVEQFTEYLEWTGMTEFTGFKEEMFEFLVSPERNADAKTWVRGAVEALADRLLHGDSGLTSFNAFYSARRVGNFGKASNHYWAAFGPQKFKDWAHQTFSMGEEELSVFVNLEMLPVIQKLRKKMRADGQFKELLCNLPAPFFVRISERIQRRPRMFESNRLAEVRTSIDKKVRYGITDVDCAGMEYFERLLFDVRLPDIAIGRSFSRSQVLALSEPDGEGLVNEILRTMKELHPLVEFING